MQNKQHTRDEEVCIKLNYPLRSTHTYTCTYAGGEGLDDEGLGDGRSQRGEGAGIGRSADGGARRDASGGREHYCEGGEDEHN